jgi:predicted amidohydrolase
MSGSVRAAVVQMDITINDIPKNTARVLQSLRTAAAQGAKLVVFPEACLGGYCFSSAEEASSACLEFADPILQRTLPNAAAELGVAVVIGFLERGDDCIHNSAALLSEDGSVQIYRKTHLPRLGVDRFVQPGAELGSLMETTFGRVGCLICYDVRFPEAARAVGLAGAHILALPTNWPEGAETAPEFITRSRAWESRMWVLAANRVGVERGRRFIGRSQIVSPAGHIVCEAGSEEETILYHDLDLSPAEQKRIVIEPGEWELDITGDRRPELYEALTRKSEECR